MAKDFVLKCEVDEKRGVKICIIKRIFVPLHPLNRRLTFFKYFKL